VDANKDQTYFLYALQPDQLARSRFPVGGMTKAEVRALARRIGLPNSGKKDSTGICFIGERPFRDFLKRYLPPRPGPIETAEGKVVGEHEGLAYYTLGQRRGLGLGGRRDGNGEAWYVAGKDLARNALIAVQGRGHPRLYRRELLIEECNWISRTAPDRPLRCAAKTRYRQGEQPCTVEPVANDRYRVRFARPQWAPTPGQSVVLYRREECLGGGLICDADPSPA
jgi:tRNA-specific 2-thiouridylase